jgi:hypothetical protein
VELEQTTQLSSFRKRAAPFILEDLTALLFSALFLDVRSAEVAGAIDPANLRVALRWLAGSSSYL